MSAAIQIFVAWHEQRRQCLGSELPGLPENQGGHVQPPVQCIDMPSRRFSQSHVHVNLVGPLPSVRSYTHVFTVVDY